jgi:hypothetical protein
MTRLQTRELLAWISAFSISKIHILFKKVKENSTIDICLIHSCRQFSLVCSLLQKSRLFRNAADNLENSAEMHWIKSWKCSEKSLGEDSVRDFRVLDHFEHSSIRKLTRFK